LDAHTLILLSVVIVTLPPEGSRSQRQTWRLWDVRYIAVVSWVGTLGILVEGGAGGAAAQCLVIGWDVSQNLPVVCFDT